MNLRLKTDKDIEQLLNTLQSNLQFSSKAAVMRLAIGFSFKETVRELIEEDAKKFDSLMLDGNDYQRYTIFGDDEKLYKIMMEEHLKKHLTDEEFFPKYTYLYIKKGIHLLNSEFLYCKNRDSFFNKLFK